MYSKIITIFAVMLLVIAIRYHYDNANLNSQYIYYRDLSRELRDSIDKVAKYETKKLLYKKNGVVDTLLVPTLIVRDGKTKKYLPEIFKKQKEVF